MMARVTVATMRDDDATVAVLGPGRSWSLVDGVGAQRRRVGASAGGAVTLARGGMRSEQQLDQSKRYSHNCAIHARHCDGS